jgi:excisionase family DNA binding protein
MDRRSVTRPKAQNETKLTISLDEAAWRLSVSPSFLRLEIDRGKLKPTRLGRRVLISEGEIRRYIAHNSRAAT